MTTLPAHTRYVVHIGRHKTGTSSLQRALSSQADQLAEAGFWYPNAGRDPNNRGRSTMIAHHRLADELRSGEPGAIAAELLAETEDKPGCVVISSEALQNVPPVDLAQLFPPDESVIVVYLREQVSYLLSAYAQRVQANDYFAPLDDYIDAHLKQLNYVPGLDALAETFGPDRLLVRAYDRAYLVGTSTVADFYTILGVDLLVPTGDGNPSINANTVFVKRLMNAFGATEPDGLYNKLPELSAQLGGPSTVAISAERQAEIRALYIDSNRDLFTRYIGTPNGTFVMTDYSGEDTHYTQDQVLSLVQTAFEALAK